MVWSGIWGFFLLEHDPVDRDTAIFGIAVHTFHAVVADLFRLKITPVALSAADAFPVIQYARTMILHILFLLLY